jgi:hypothetical protein
MADLNALIAQGAQFQAPPDPFAQYGKMQQLQAGVTQNALAQYQLSSAKRADDLNDGMLKYMQSPDYKPEGLTKFGTPGIAALKSVTEAKNAGLTGQKTQMEIQKGKQEFVQQTQRDISRNPSDANITAYKEDIQMNSLFSDAEKQQLLSAADRFLAMPLTERQSFLASQGAKSADLKPTITPQNLGGTVRAISTGAFGGPATVVPGSEQTTTMTPFETARVPILQQQANTSADQLKVSQGQLKVAQDRLKKEGAQLDPTENLILSQAIAEGRVDINKVNGRNAKFIVGALQNTPGIDLREMSFDNVGSASAARTLGTQGASQAAAATEVTKMVPLVKHYVDNVDPGNYPVLNAAGMYVARNTGDTNATGLAQSLNALVNTYARVINPKGIATKSDKDHIREVINQNMTGGQFAEFLDVVLPAEMKAAVESSSDAAAVLKEQRQKGRPGAATPAPAAVSAQDKQALDWANANPSDPRAAKIKAQLGAK